MSDEKLNWLILAEKFAAGGNPHSMRGVAREIFDLDKNCADGPAIMAEAALDLGASPATALRKIVLPQIMPGIISHFVKMLSKAVDGQMVSEDYCIDESHAVIHMEGTKGKISAAYLRQ